MNNSIINRLKNSRLFKDILKLAFVIAGCFVLASFSPSLDGRAIVVEPGVFPEGLFAKTVGYLPGDIISVTNITGETTIDILVIGALDPSEGVAIMLSPEAADAIGISRNANNIVKITKRSNQDERVYGSAVIASQNKDSSESKPAETKPVETKPAPVETKPVETKPVEEVYTPAPVEEPEPVVQEPEVIESTPQPQYTEPEPVYEEEHNDFASDDVQEYPYEDFNDNLGDEKFDETQTVPYKEEEIYSKPVEEKVEEEPVIEYDYVDDEDLPAIDEKPADESEYISSTDENTAPEVVEEPVQEPAAVEEPVEEAAPEDEAVYEEFEDEGIDSLPQEEEKPVEQPVEEEPAEVVEEAPAEEAPVEEVEEPVAEPVEEEPVEEEYIDDEELPQEIVEEEPVEEEPVEEEASPIEEENEDFEDGEFVEETEEPAAEETPVEEVVEDEIEEPEDFIDVEPEEEPAEEVIEEAPVEEEPVAEEAPVEEETVPEDDEVEVLEPEEEEYDAIVLVPAEDNPPVNEEPEDEVFEDEANPLIPLNPEFNASITNTDVETEVETEIETETSAQIVQPVSSGNETDYAKFMVDGLDQLEADKYYIQIATLKDDANILEIVNKYGKKYPITIVPTAKGTKQVLVGPVTMDEYGTVLARFKSYGYKDAFLRKGTNPNPKPRVQADEK